MAFGPFVLHAGQRALTRDGRAVDVNARSLGILTVLIERPGTVFGKSELMERVWPDRTVDDVNLRVAVTALRRALALAGGHAEYVITTVGRGYSFSPAIPVERWPPAPQEPAGAGEPRALRAAGRVPLLLKPVIGRDRDVERTIRLLSGHRLVTVVGPAGIGKTTLAVAAASRLSGGDRDVRFVDFARERDAELVPARIVAALTTDPPDGDPLEAVTGLLADRRMLVIFDNCEHVLEAAADAASAILQHAPDVEILATSREPLHADGEVTFRLDTLGYPDEEFAGTAEDACAFPAVRLLLERIQAATPDFVMADEAVAPAVEICRRLDGIALAIQLAAGRVVNFGLSEVASRLDDRFRFLNQGIRSALPRHQTLEAAVSWSFELLDTQERLVCERLAIFSGRFSLDAAVQVAGYAPVAPQDVASILANLVEKSLVVFVAGERRPSYVFLETIRNFARERFRIFDTNNELFRRLGACLAEDCDRFMEIAAKLTVADAGVVARRLFDDLRYAVDRSAEMGDGRLLVQLVTKSAPLMIHLGMTFELKEWTDRALEVASDDAERLPLLICRGHALNWSSPDHAAQTEASREAVEIAIRLEDGVRQLDALWGLAMAAYADRRPRLGYEQALALGDAAARLGDGSASRVAEALKMCALHDLGEYGRSAGIGADLLRHYTVDGARADAYRFGVNPRVMALCTMGSLAWQNGGQATAVPILEEAVNEAGEHLPSLFLAMSQVVSLGRVEAADWTGASDYVDRMARRFGFNPRWKGWIETLRTVMDSRDGGTRGVLDGLCDAIMANDWSGLCNRAIWVAVPVAECCLSTGEIDVARELTGRLLTEARKKELRWLMPEALRLRASATIDVDRAEAGAALDEARDLAAELGASVYAARVEAARTRLGDILPAR